MANRLLELALASPWAITPEGMQALLDIYQHAVSNKTDVDEEALAQVYADQSELAQALHYKGTADQEYSVQKPTRLEGTKYVNVLSNGVAIMSLFGPIFPRANMMTDYSGAVSITQFTADFVRAYHNAGVAGIVLDIDSPGGAVTKIGDSSKIIHALSSSGKKPVAAFASGFMASAAYYVGSAVGKGRIFASESAEIGSIGVILQMMKQANIINIVSSKAPNKRPDPDTEEGKAALQRRVDDLHEIFAKDVGIYRGIDIEKVYNNFGQGDVFVGAKAKSMGLVDKVSTIGEVVNIVAREATKSATSTSLGRKLSSDAEALLSYTNEDINIMGLGDFLKGIMPSATTDDDTETNETVASGQSDDNDGNDDAAEGQIEQAIVVQSLTDKTRVELEAEFAPTAILTAKNLVLQGKIHPSEQAQATLDLVTAKIDDAMFGGADVEFINNKGQLVTGTREEAANARYDNRKAHSLTVPAISGVKTEGTKNISATVLADTEDDASARQKVEGPMTEERRNQLLNASSAGRVVVQQGQASK